MRLNDCLESVDEMASYAARSSRADFLTTRMMRSAVEREIEIIAIALKRAAVLNRDIPDRISAYRKIMGMRNRIAHEYQQIDYEIVWDVVQYELIDLRQELEILLREANERLAGS